MQVRHAEEQDSRNLARLHQACLAHSVFGSLSQRSGERLYTALASSPDAIVLMAKSDAGDTIGGMIASFSALKMTRLLVHSRLVTRAAAAAMRHPCVWSKQLAEDVLLSRRSMASAKIIALYVHPDQRRLGVAQALLHAMIVELSIRDAASISVQTRLENEAARQSYRRAGFEEHAVCGSSIALIRRSTH